MTEECACCGQLVFPKRYDGFRIRKGVNHQTGRSGFVLHYKASYVDNAPSVTARSCSVFLLTRQGAEEMRAMLTLSDGIGQRHSRAELEVFRSDKARDDAQRFLLAR